MGYRSLFLFILSITSIKLILIICYLQGGQERFAPIAQTFYRVAHGIFLSNNFFFSIFFLLCLYIYPSFSFFFFVIVFSLAHPEDPFIYLDKLYLDVESFAPEHKIVYLIGNKAISHLFLGYFVSFVK